mmetsp:Transcript_1099/g.2575  ORF Transcript_1099/g.2575 Transcript_1099/m.2575 type:complete len:212 (+) Transcript_1099:551-1186(+)
MAVDELQGAIPQTVHAVRLHPQAQDVVGVEGGGQEAPAQRRRAAEPDVRRGFHQLQHVVSAQRQLAAVHVVHERLHRWAARAGQGDRRRACNRQAGRQRLHHAAVHRHRAAVRAHEGQVATLRVIPAQLRKTGSQRVRVPAVRLRDCARWLLSRALRRQHRALAHLGQPLCLRAVRDGGRGHRLGERAKYPCRPAPVDSHTAPGRPTGVEG